MDDEDRWPRRLPRRWLSHESVDIAHPQVGVAHAGGGGDRLTAAEAHRHRCRRAGRSGTWATRRVAPHGTRLRRRDAPPRRRSSPLRSGSGELLCIEVQPVELRATGVFVDEQHRTFHPDTRTPRRHRADQARGRECDPLVGHQISGRLRSSRSCMTRTRSSPLTCGKPRDLRPSPGPSQSSPIVVPFRSTTRRAGCRASPCSEWRDADQILGGRHTGRHTPAPDAGKAVLAPSLRSRRRSEVVPSVDRPMTAECATQVQACVVRPAQLVENGVAGATKGCLTHRAELVAVRVVKPPDVLACGVDRAADRAFLDVAVSWRRVGRLLRSQAYSSHVPIYSS